MAEKLIVMTTGKKEKIYGTITGSTYRKHFSLHFNSKITHQVAVFESGLKAEYLSVK